MHHRFYFYNRIVKAKLFIDENYHEKIDLENIADEACFSKFHFTRMFKSIYLKTPHQYLAQVRIENAKMLLTRNHNVTETCFLVGFDSVTSFTALFKKSEGLTPSQYQKQWLEKKSRMVKAPLEFVPHCFAVQSGWIKNSNFQEVV